jgi:HAD superfamily hydrolase (TIGR01490 family)
MDEALIPSVAAFDLDGTLTQGGSVFPWLRDIAGSPAVLRASLRHVGALTVGAIRSGSSADNAKERLFLDLLSGRALDEVSDESRRFALAHLEEEARPQVIARLDWHREQGHDVVIVSASPQIYVDVVAQELKATGALGTRLAVDPLGQLTGGYLGKNCRGSEKMRRLQEWIEERRYSVEPVVYAYGNSRGDRRMLDSATYPYNVGRLGALGRLRRFPRLPRS